MHINADYTTQFFGGEDHLVVENEIVKAHSFKFFLEQKTRTQFDLLLVYYDKHDLEFECSCFPDIPSDLVGRALKHGRFKINDSGTGYSFSSPITDIRILDKDRNIQTNQHPIW